MAMTRMRSGNPTRTMKMKPLHALLPLGLAAALLTGCVTAPTTQMAPNPAHIHSSAQHRKLFVFLDGTSNDWRARTNVRRLRCLMGKELFSCDVAGVVPGDLRGLLIAEMEIKAIAQGQAAAGGNRVIAGVRVG